MANITDEEKEKSIEETKYPHLYITKRRIKRPGKGGKINKKPFVEPDKQFTL